MSVFSRCYFLIVCAATACLTPVRAADIYVAPTGSDSAAGTQAAPYQTLAKARDAARAARSGAAGQPVTVWLAGGNYPASDKVKLTAEDAGTAAAPTVWRNIDGQTPRLLGGRRLTASDFRAVTNMETLERIAPEAKGKIVALDLKALNVLHSNKPKDVFSDWGGLPDLFVDGKRMPLARFPNDGAFMTIKRVLRNAGGPADGNWRTPAVIERVDPNGLGGEFEYREEFRDKHAVWQKLLARGIWFKGYWRVAWQSEAIRVHSIDTQRHTVTFAKPINGGIGNKYFRPQGNGREVYCVLNLLEEVDRPGEWCIDYVDQKLYFYPPSALDAAEVLLADCEKPVVSLDGASHVTVRGLRVEGSLGHGIAVKGGEGNLVAGCTVCNVDNYAVWVEGGKSHAVISSDLFELGSGGVWLSGGNERSQPRVAAGHRVVNNHIHHFARLQVVYAPGVNCGFTGGGGGGHHEAVGMYVANNLIHDTPHAGVLFGSWDSVFEFNEVFRYCEVSNDMGAFYAYDHYGRFGGHTFRCNLMHSSPDGDGIYLDCDHPDITLFGNIAFLKSGSGKRGTGFLYRFGKEGMHLQSIDCRNNIAVDCNYGFSFCSAKPAEAKIENNVAVRAGKAPFGWSAFRDGKAVGEDFSSGANKIYESDPGFVDLERMNFRLKPDAQLLKDLPRFQPIPVEKIGLFVDEYRKRLPTDEEVERFSRPMQDTGLHYDIKDRK